MSEPVYSISRPRPSAALWLLAGLTAVGLAALFLAAYAAFRHIMPWVQAVFAALLIEAGMVVEAIALIRGRNWLAAIGLVISLAVSGTYNFIQAQTAGAGLHPVMLLALALGPLSALTFLAMATGRELSHYEIQVLDWELKRQQWLDRQRIRLERKEERFRQLSGPEKPSGKLPEKVPGDWRKLTSTERNLITGVSVSEIVAKHAVSERTARNWKRRLERGERQ